MMLGTLRPTRHRSPARVSRGYLRARAAGGAHRQHDPEDSIRSRQLWPRLARFPHGKLLPQCEVLERRSRCVRTELLSVPRTIPSHLIMTAE